MSETKGWGWLGMVGMALGITVLALAQGCATTKISREQLSGVHKVAVVGFGVQQRVPNSGKTVLNALMSSGSDNPAGMALEPARIAEPAPHAEKMYEGLEGTLRKELSWDVLPQKALAQKPAYAKFFREKTKQPQFRPMVSGKNVEMFHPQGIVESALLSSMSPEERRALIRELGVDAIAIATVRVELENEGGLKKLVGAGEFRPVTTVGFHLYTPGSEEPAWMDLNAKGASKDPAVEHALGFADGNALNLQAVAATQAAYADLLAHYRQ
jgi:hypothetical protein